MPAIFAAARPPPDPMVPQVHHQVFRQPSDKSPGAPVRPGEPTPVTIKRKLSLILGMLVAMAVLFASMIAWNTVQVTRSVRFIGPSLDALTVLKDVSKKILVVESSLIHSLIYDEPFNRAELADEGASIREMLDRLATLVRGRKGLGVRSEERTLAGVQTLRERLRAFLEKADAVIAARERKDPRSARQLMEQEAGPLLDELLAPQVALLIEEEIEEISEVYQRIVLGLGGLPPWERTRVLRDIDVARSTVDYIVAIEQFDTAARKQVEKLIAYIAFSGSADRTKFASVSADAEVRMAAVFKVIRHQIDLGIEAEQEQLRDLETVELLYQRIMKGAGSVFALAEEGKRLEAKRLFDRSVKSEFDAFLFPSIGSLRAEGRTEVDREHETLLKNLRRSVVTTLLILAVSGAVIIAISLSLIRGILRPLNRLKEGTEIIRSGNLEHRIPEGSQDEFGELSESFNRMTESLRESNEELKSFAYIVSHDLRAPLVNIRGFAAELRHGCRDLERTADPCLSGMNEKERDRLLAILRKDIPEALGFIDSSVGRMDGLISAILKLSRMGRGALRQETIDLGDLVETIFKSLAHQLEEKKVSIMVGAMPPVVADRMAMEQIMGNLIDNALKYLDSARAGVLEISAEQGARDTIICVRDNGRGVPPADQQKIFEIFQRSGRQDVPGEGMGLAYVKALVKRHGGRIWCESVPSSGSTFSFTIANIPEPASRRAS